MNEQEYLAKQAEQAQAAIHTVLKQMGQTLQPDIDPRQWPQAHPWLCVGSAAASGFLAAWMLTPASQESFRQRMDEMAAYLAKYKPTPESKAAAEAERSIHPSRTWSTIRKMLGEIISGALIASTRGISQGGSQGQTSVSGNGHHQEPEEQGYEFTNPT